MNYFLKYRYAVLTIIMLTAIIIAGIITIFINTYRPSQPGDDKKKLETGQLFQKELGLNTEQEKFFKENRQEYFKKIREMYKTMNIQRVAMIEEMSKLQPDTAKLFKIADSIGRLHADLKRQTIFHLLKLRSVCTPKQIEKLNILNKRLINPEGEFHKMDKHKWPKPKWNKDTLLSK